MRLGLKLSTSRGARAAFLGLLQRWAPDARATTTDRLGWADESCAAFVTGAGRVIGDERVVYQTEHAPGAAAEMRPAGSLDEWRAGVGAACIGNPMMVLAVSLAFTGALFEPMQAEGGGLHFRGQSSRGKSNLLPAGVSVWGSPKFLQSWRAMSNVLEGVAAACNGSLIALDEMGEISAREAGATTYMLANGQGKARAARTGTARPAARWRTAVLSSGEISLSDKMAEAGQRTRAGQEVRLLDVQTDGQTFGAFDELHGRAEPAAFAEHVGRTAAAAYGTAGPAFVEHLVADLAGSLDAVRALAETFKTQAAEALDLPDEGQTRWAPGAASPPLPQRESRRRLGGSPAGQRARQAAPPLPACGSGLTGAAAPGRPRTARRWTAPAPSSSPTAMHALNGSKTPAPRKGRAFTTGPAGARACSTTSPQTYGRARCMPAPTRRRPPARCRPPATSTTTPAASPPRRRGRQAGRGPIACRSPSRRATAMHDPSKSGGAGAASGVDIAYQEVTRPHSDAGPWGQRGHVSGPAPVAPPGPNAAGPRNALKTKAGPTGPTQIDVARLVQAVRSAFDAPQSDRLSDALARLREARARLADLADADGVCRSPKGIAAVWDEAEALAGVLGAASRDPPADLDDIDDPNARRLVAECQFPSRARDRKDRNMKDNPTRERASDLPLHALAAVVLQARREGISDSDIAVAALNMALKLFREYHGPHAATFAKQMREILAEAEALRLAEIDARIFGAPLGSA